MKGKFLCHPYGRRETLGLIRMMGRSRNQSLSSGLHELVFLEETYLAVA